MKTIPKTWHEVSLAQYARLYDLATVEADVADLVAALLGIEKIELLSMPMAEFDAVLQQDYQWMNTPPPVLPEMPRVYVLDGVSYAVPTEFNNLAYGQILLFQMAISQNLAGDMVHPRVYPRLLATVLCTANKTPFDEDEVARLEPLCEAIPFVEAMPAINFFLRSLQPYVSASKSTYNITPAPTRLKRVWAGLISLGRTLALGWLWRPKVSPTAR